MGRELDDAILMLRTNNLEVGTWILKTEGDIDRVLAVDATLAKLKDHWLVREKQGETWKEIMALHYRRVPGS